MPVEHDLCTLVESIHKRGVPIQMSNEEFTDIVAPHLDQAALLAQHKQPRAPICNKYFDALFCNNSREEITYDFHVVSLVAKNERKVDGHLPEGRLAAMMHTPMRDQKFQESLDRLESRGMIVRTTREWGFRGEWIELSDELRKLHITTKGDYFGHQSAQDLGIGAYIARKE
jgi:hypothetical protein